MDVGAIRPEMILLAAVNAVTDEHILAAMQMGVFVATLELMYTR